MPNPPDFGLDLNAMHEAEKTLENPDINAIQEELNIYAEILSRISRSAGNHYTFQATAAQRREAFLRAKGLEQCPPSPEPNSQT